MEAAPYGGKPLRGWDVLHITGFCLMTSSALPQCSSTECLRNELNCNGLSGLSKRLTLGSLFARLFRVPVRRRQNCGHGAPRLCPRVLTQGHRVQSMLFLNGKTRSLYFQKKKPANLSWTATYRKLHKKDQAGEAAKRNRRKLKSKRPRAIGNLTIEVRLSSAVTHRSGAASAFFSVPTPPQCCKNRM